MKRAVGIVAAAVTCGLFVGAVWLIAPFALRAAL